MSFSDFTNLINRVNHHRRSSSEPRQCYKGCRRVCSSAEAFSDYAAALSFIYEEEGSSLLTRSAEPVVGPDRLLAELLLCTLNERSRIILCYIDQKNRRRVNTKSTRPKQRYTPVCGFSQFNVDLIFNLDEGYYRILLVYLIWRAPNIAFLHAVWFLISYFDKSPEELLWNLARSFNIKIRWDPLPFSLSFLIGKGDIIKRLSLWAHWDRILSTALIVVRQGTRPSKLWLPERFAEMLAGNFASPFVPSGSYERVSWETKEGLQPMLRSHSNKRDLNNEPFHKLLTCQMQENNYPRLLLSSTQQQHQWLPTKNRIFHVESSIDSPPPGLPPPTASYKTSGKGVTPVLDFFPLMACNTSATTSKKYVGAYDSWLESLFCGSHTLDSLQTKFEDHTATSDPIRLCSQPLQGRPGLEFPLQGRSEPLQFPLQGRPEPLQFPLQGRPEPLKFPLQGRPQTRENLSSQGGTTTDKNSSFQGRPSTTEASSSMTASLFQGESNTERPISGGKPTSGRPLIETNFSSQGGPNTEANLSTIKTNLPLQHLPSQPMLIEKSQAISRSELPWLTRDSSSEEITTARIDTSTIEVSPRDNLTPRSQRKGTPRYILQSTPQLVCPSQPQEILDPRLGSTYEVSYRVDPQLTSSRQSLFEIDGSIPMTQSPQIQEDSESRSAVIPNEEPLAELEPYFPSFEECRSSSSKRNESRPKSSSPIWFEDKLTALKLDALQWLFPLYEFEGLRQVLKQNENKMEETIRSLIKRDPNGGLRASLRVAPIEPVDGELLDLVGLLERLEFFYISDPEWLIAVESALLGIVAQLWPFDKKNTLSPYRIVWNAIINWILSTILIGTLKCPSDIAAEVLNTQQAIARPKEDPFIMNDLTPDTRPFLEVIKHFSEYTKKMCLASVENLRCIFLDKLVYRVNEMGNEVDDRIELQTKTALMHWGRRLNSSSVIGGGSVTVTSYNNEDPDIPKVTLPRMVTTPYEVSGELEAAFRQKAANEARESIVACDKLRKLYNSNKQAALAAGAYNEAHRYAALATALKKSLPLAQDHYSRVIYNNRNTTTEIDLLENLSTGSNHHMTHVVVAQIDLHGIHVSPALDLLEEKLSLYSERTASLEAGRSYMVHIITGRGIHATGGVSRLREAAIDWLRNQHLYRWRREGKGGFLVIVHPKITRR